MPSIHFRKTVDAEPDEVYAALTTEEGLAGNWTDQLEVPEQTGEVARFGFGPDWAKTLDVRIDALEPGRRVEWTPVGGSRTGSARRSRGSSSPPATAARSCTSRTEAGPTSTPTARWPCAPTPGR